MKYEVVQFFEIWNDQQSHECIVIGNADDFPECMKIEQVHWEEKQRETEQIIILDIEQVELAIECMGKWIINEKAKKLKPL